MTTEPRANDDRCCSPSQLVYALYAVSTALVSIPRTYLLSHSRRVSRYVNLLAPWQTEANDLKLFYIAEYFYATSAAIIKSSIAVTLMRIAATQRRYSWSLYAIIGFTWVAAIVFVAGIASICTCRVYYKRSSLTNVQANPSRHSGGWPMVLAIFS